MNLFNYLLRKEETDRNTFNIALGRFSMGISRNNTIDKLIDFMIGLESLYLPDDNSELVFKLSLRIAFLINDNRENAKSDFEFVKKMYGKRSRVVHGDKSDITGSEIKNIENILRKSLHLYIKEPKKFSKEYLRKEVYFS